MAFFQTETLWVNELSDSVAALVLDVPGGQGNPLGLRVLDDLERALDAVDRAERFRLLVIRSGKAVHFASGPELDDLAALKTTADFTNFARRGQAVLKRLAELSIPSVAVIAGSCQGAGVELTLACDYRVLVDEPKTRLGFADLELGLMPAWGGTWRLPRLIGLERSLHMLLGDRQVAAATAVDWGLADSLVRTNEDQPPSFLDQPRKRGHDKLPLRTWRQWLLEGFPSGRWLIFRGIERILRQRVPDDLPAPWAILDTLRHGLEHDFDAGLHKETESLAVLGQDSAFHNLLRLKTARNEVRQVRFPAAAGKRLRRVGVVGAGQHGIQLVYLAVSRGCQVVIREKDETSLGTAFFRLLPLFQQAVQQGLMQPGQVQKNLAAITGTTAWKGFADLDVVLEAVGTNLDDPGQLFREIARHTGPETLMIATSETRNLPEIRKRLNNVSRVGGLHFVAPGMPGAAVEVVRDDMSDEEKIRELAGWVVHLTGVPVVVRASPGLLVTRVWLAGIHEAILLLQQDFTAGRIDAALRRFGMTRGPLELADLLGMESLAAVATERADRFPGMGTFFTHMISKGWLGTRKRAGFYLYQRRGQPENRAVRLVARQMKDPVLTAEGPLSMRDQVKLFQERILARTVIEAGWCLQEGVVESEADADLALAASGWAPHRGGPLTYAREHDGAWLEELAERYGPRFVPCANI